MPAFKIEFKPSGRGAARCPSDPEYPNGMDLDCSVQHEPSCLVTLPYPAPECGMWSIRCAECELSLLVTAAGRADDPKTVWVNCKKDNHEQRF